MAFADSFDLSYAVKSDIQIMTTTKLSLRMRTNSLALFDILTNATMNTERRLTIDLSSVKKRYGNE